LLKHSTVVFSVLT